MYHLTSPTTPLKSYNEQHTLTYSQEKRFRPLQVIAHTFSLDLGLGYPSSSDAKGHDFHSWIQLGGHKLSHLSNWPLFMIVIFTKSPLHLLEYTLNFPPIYTFTIITIIWKFDLISQQEITCVQKKVEGKRDNPKVPTTSLPSNAPEDSVNCKAPQSFGLIFSKALKRNHQNMF